MLALVCRKRQRDTVEVEIDKESLEEFKKLYQEEFGEELTNEDAEEMVQRLLALYEVLANPLPKSPEERFDSRHESS